MMAVGCFGAIQVKARLIGQSVDPVTRREIADFLEAQPELGKIFSLITLQLGNEIMVAVHAEMAQTEAPTSVSITRINAIEMALKQRLPDGQWSFFQPD